MVRERSSLVTACYGHNDGSLSSPEQESVSFLLPAISPALHSGLPCQYLLFLVLEALFLFYRVLMAAFEMPPSKICKFHPRDKRKNIRSLTEICL